MAGPTKEALEDTANRRRQLKAWISLHHDGKQAEFVKAHKLNQPEISGLLRTKSFGSARARRLEGQTGMPKRYLDERAASEASPHPLAPEEAAPIVEITETDWGHLEAYKDMSDEDAAFIRAETERRHLAYKKLREEVLVRAGVPLNNGKHDYHLPAAPAAGTVTVRIVAVPAPSAAKFKLADPIGAPAPASKAVRRGGKVIK